MRQPARHGSGEGGKAIPHPPVVLMWLATGQRRTSLHIARLVSGFLAMLVLLGPAAGAAPADAADRGTPPAPLLGSGLRRWSAAEDG